MKRLLWVIPFLATACSGQVETVTLSGQVTLPIESASAFKIDGTPLLISNFDGSLGKLQATTLDAGGRFSFRIERSSLPESAQWFKLVLVHPSLNGPMLSRALVLSRAGKDSEKMEVTPYSSLVQMAVEYQYQLDPARVPTTLSPVTLEETFVTKPDAYLINGIFHTNYAKYASGSTTVPPAADTELATGARELLFSQP